MGGKLGEVGVAEVVEPPLGCLIRWPNDPNISLRRRRRDHARGGNDSAMTNRLGTTYSVTSCILNRKRSQCPGKYC